MKDRLDPQPVTLDVRPIELYRDEPGRAEALGAANGRDLVLERINLVAGLAAVVVALVFVLACLTGCAALDRAVPALGVAHDVARAGCAILAASDGSAAAVLAANQAMQRQVLDAQAQAAIERGANKAEIEALQASVVVLSAAVRASAEQIVRAAGNGPAKLAPCPADPPAEPKP